MSTPSQEAVEQARRMIARRFGGRLSVEDREDVLHDAVVYCLVRQVDSPDAYFTFIVGRRPYDVIRMREHEGRALAAFCAQHATDGLPTLYRERRQVLHGEAYREHLRAAERARRRERTGA